MLNRVLNAAGLDLTTCATLLGISPQVFDEWASGQRAIPESTRPLLSAVLGVPESMLSAPEKAFKNADDADITPAIWFKFRDEELVDADRECVVLIRQLGHYLNQLEEVTGKRSVQWKTLFEAIRNSVNLQASPKEQGRAAARIFRESTALGHGAVGSGEIIRGLLRSLGVLVIETPLKESRLEGCSFYVGSTELPRPCVFANTHHVTWFRRNIVLFHEVGHAIFEAQSTGASLDFVSASEADLLEIRAQAFAQEALVPREVLLHVAQARGLKWSALSQAGLAQIVADTHVELSTVVTAATEAGLVDHELSAELRNADISGYLPELSDHALTTEQYLHKIGETRAGTWLGKRTTTLPSRALRLPVSYVTSVIEACANRVISEGKAAEFLMIDTRDFAERFPEALQQATV